LCGLFFFSLTAQAEQNIQIKQRFEILQSEIAQLQIQMQSNRTEYDRLQNNLQTAEKYISQLKQSLRNIRKQLPLQRDRFRRLQLRKNQYNQVLTTQQQQLSKQMHSAYIMGRQDYLKLLLNQEDPDSLGRVLTYYDYFNRARAQHIETINQTLEQLQILSVEINQETQNLKNLSGEQNKQKSALETHNQERRVILATLGEDYDQQTEKLNRLNENKKHLKKLLGRVRAVLPEYSQAGKPFRRLKRKLPYPVQGKLLHRFGEKRGIGSLKWQGLTIAAPMDTAVHAVAAGRVVYADWFRNLGQLLIIEHSDGYMSLYGYNHQLYKQVGDSVKPSEVIASVGNSGGQKTSSLYFELRHRGQVINPKKWLKKS
jgi:septal ring factor EnvC (AmiA/AmiB activator)